MPGYLPHSFAGIGYAAARICGGAFVLSGVLAAGACWAVPQKEVDGGIFFEAEDYDARIRGRGFATPTGEPLASGGAMLTGMWQPGAIAYQLSVAEAGKYYIWVRYAAPANTTMKFSFDTIDEKAFTLASVPMTTAKLDAPDAYRWHHIGQAQLNRGETLFVVGQGALRPDCFFFTPRTDFTATDDLLAHIQAVREAAKGRKLPELVHTRRITRHPGWLKHALRVCYAHFEWDRDTTPDAWCKRAAAAGANCIIGAGEMPAGTLDGKLKPFGYEVFNRAPNFKFPEGYDLSYKWVKEFVDAAHRYGLKIAIYGGAWRTLDPLVVEHPEWRQKDAQGRIYPNGFGSWHSPYRQAYIQRWVDVAKLSGLDGIMIDMLFTGPTNGDYSEYTVAAFREKFGVDPPTEPDPRNLIWQRWIDFQNWTREEMLLDLTEALHAVNPEIAVIVNQTEGWIFNGTDRNFLTSRVGQCVDGLLEEMGWDFRSKWERPWAWPVDSAWQNLYLHCRSRPGYGVMWHMTMNFPEAHTQCLSYSMLANGTAPAVVTGGNWPDMTKVWQHIKGCEPWVEEAQLVPWMALHFGEDTLDWYANARGEETYTAYMKNVFGFFQAALELHLPIEIINDDALTDVTQLKRYATVVLPNSACLSDAQAHALAAYVQEGGGLVASYETGRYDEDGTKRETPVLQSLFGTMQYDPVQSTSWDMPLDDVDHPILAHADIKNAGAWKQGQSEPAKYGTLYVGPSERFVGAVAVGPPVNDAISVPLTGAGTRKPPGATDDVTYKTLIARKVGNGKVVFFPLDIGHAYYVFNHPLNRRLIAQALEWTASCSPPLKTDALMRVQTVLYEKNGAKIVHLVNDVSSFGRAAAPNPEAWTAFRYEVAPAYDITVEVQGAYGRAMLLPSGQTLEVDNRDNWTSALVPRLDIHAMVVFMP